MFRLNRTSRYIILILTVLALYLTVGYVLMVFSIMSQIAIFKPAPVDVSIPVDMEIAEVYTYPRSPLRVDIFAKASGYRGYDALRVKDGRLVGRRIYPSQLGAAIRVAGEEEYRTYHMSRVGREGAPQRRETRLESVTESPLTRFEFLLPLLAIITGAGFLFGWLAWKLGRRIVKDRVAPVVAAVLVTAPLLMYLIRVVALAV